MNTNVIGGCDFLNQVVRHAIGKRATAGDQRDSIRIFRQMDGCLPCRIACTSNIYPLSLHCLRFGNGTPIENSSTKKRFYAGDSKPAVGSTHRKYNGMTCDLPSIRESHDALFTLGV